MTPRGPFQLLPFCDYHFAQYTEVKRFAVYSAFSPMYLISLATLFYFIYLINLFFLFYFKVRNCAHLHQLVVFQCWFQLIEGNPLLIIPCGQNKLISRCFPSLCRVTWFQNVFAWWPLFSCIYLNFSYFKRGAPVLKRYWWRHKMCSLS